MSNEEFEELFGNTPFENIKKIKEYINKNFVSKDKIREKLKELKQEGSYFSNGYYDSGAKLILEELLEE